MPRVIVNAAKLYPGLDCVTVRDFQQYYRNRYFGIQYPDAVELCPAYLGSNWTNENAGVAHPKDALPIWVYRNGEVKQHIIVFQTLETLGRFGNPALGNTLLGPTYAYYMGYPVRESAKGLSLVSPESTSPNGDSLVSKYPKKFPAIRYRNGVEFGHKMELPVVHQIYNPTYYEFNEAVEELTSGNRLGTPLNRTTGLFLQEGSRDILVSHKDIPNVGKLIGGHPRVVLKRRFGFLASSLQQSFQNLDVQVD